MDDGSFRTTRQHAKAVDESVRSVPDRLVSTFDLTAGMDLTAGVEKTPDTPERYEEGRDGSRFIQDRATASQGSRRECPFNAKTCRCDSLFGLVSHETPGLPSDMRKDGIVDGSFRTARQHAKTVDESVRSVSGRLVSTLDLTAGMEKTPDTPERYEEGRNG